MISHYKSILFLIFIMPVGMISLLLGTLVYPGWNLTPLHGMIREQLEQRVPGLDFELGRAHVQLRGGTLLTVELDSVRLAQAGDGPTIALEDAGIVFPLKRLFHGRMIPDRIHTKGVRVWVEVDETGTLRLPQWVNQLIQEDAAPETGGVGWEDFRLGDLPSVLRLVQGEALRIAMEDYEGRLVRGAEERVFRLPSWYIDATGRDNGLEMHWHTLGWESGNVPFATGHMEVNVPDETVDWRNEFNLPLTPGLAAWLETGFPFLPIPSFFETTVHLQSRGTIALIPMRMEVAGHVALEPGSIVLPTVEQTRLTIPPVLMEFESTLAYGEATPGMRSVVSVRLGAGKRASVLRLATRIDGAEDVLEIASSGTLSHVEDLLALLPPHLCPVGIEGDLRWDAAMETTYSHPAAVSVGHVGISSNGIRFTFDATDPKPVELEPFRLAGRIERAGREIHIEPFALQAGPVAVHGSGFHWRRDQDGSDAEGFIHLGPIDFAELLAELPSDLVTIPPEVRQWLEQTAIRQFELGIEIAGSEGVAAPFDRIRIAPAWELSVAGQSIRGGGLVEGSIVDRALHIDLALARGALFNLGIPGISRFGNLDSAVEAQLSGTITGAGESIDLALVAHTTAGTYYPGSALNGLLAGPIAFGGARWEARLSGADLWRVDIDFNAAGAPGSLEASLAVEPFAPDGLLVHPIQLGWRWNVSPADTIDLIGLLSPELWLDLPLQPEAIADIALLGFSGEAGMELGDLGVDPYLRLRDVSAQTTLQTGNEALAIHLRDHPAPGEELRVEWESGLWNIGRTGWTEGVLLPFPASTLHLPLKLSGSFHLPVSLRLSRMPRDLSQLHATVAFVLEDGHVDVNPFLRKRLAIPKAHGQAKILPSDLRIARLDSILLSEIGAIRLKGHDLGFLETAVGRLDITISDLDLAGLPPRLPFDLLPKTLRPWFDHLHIEGFLRRVDLQTVLGSDTGTKRIPGLAGLSYGVKAEQIVIEQPRLPPFSLARCSIMGDLEAVDITIENAGHAGAWIDRVHLEIMNPLGTEPEMTLSADSRSDLPEIDVILDALQMRDSLPEWIRHGGFRGNAFTSLTLHGTARQPIDPADWRIDQQIILQDFWSPLPEWNGSYGALSHSMALKWDGERLIGDYETGLHDLEVGTVINGSIRLSGTFTGFADGAFSILSELSLQDIETRFRTLATNKIRGDPASITLELSGTSARHGAASREYKADLGVRELFFDRFNLSVRSRFREGFPGAWYGFEELDLTFSGIDYSDLAVTAHMNPAGVLQIHGKSDIVNLGPALALVEPLLLDLLHPPPEQSTENDASPATAAAPGTAKDLDADETFPAIPDLEIAFDFDTIQFGNIRSVGPLRLRGSRIDGLPRHFELLFHDGDHAMELNIAPAGDEHTVVFRLSNVGNWLDAGVAPLHIFQSEPGRSNPTLAKLKTLPALFDQGDLRFSGRFRISPEPLLQLDSVSLAGMILKTEIAFLSRIAALVDRTVILLIPFKEFRVASVTVDPIQAVAHDIVMEGPINLTLDMARFQFDCRETLIQGRVFGVPFEVFGIAPDLKFYLQERSPVIRAFTAEDDFDW